MKKPFFTPEEEELIKQEAPKAEEAGTFTAPLLDLAERKKLFHLSVPASMGGHEMAVPDQLDFYEESSRLDGSFGWTTKLGASAALFSGFMNQEFAGEIYSNPRAFTAGSGYPAGTAVPVEVGYRVSGRWKYISGIYHATIFTANCVVKREGADPEEPEIRAMAFLPDEIQPLDTWNGYGLKASASHDFEVEDLIIPKERSFVMGPQPEHEGKPLYHFPFMAYAPSAIACSILGMTSAFFNEAEIHTGQNDILNEARQRLDEERKALHGSVRDLWEECRETLRGSEKGVARVDATAKNLAEACRNTAGEVYKLGGMAVLDETTRFNRTWRDLMTASQHTMVLG